MSALDIQIGRHLRQHRDEIARAVLERMVAGGAEGAGASHFNVDEEGQPECLADVGRHIEFLAQSVAVGEPALFEDYVCWFGDVAAQRVGGPAEFRAGLLATDEVLRELLPAHYIHVAQPYLRAACDTLARSHRAAEDGPASTRSHDSLPRAAHEFLAALLRGDRPRARALIDHLCRDGISVERIFLDVLQPAQREAGRLWQVGRVSIAQEHYCTAETQAVMARLTSGPLPSTAGIANTGLADSAAVPSPEKPPPVFVAACVSGEYHDVGLRMMTDLLDRAGWAVFHLGANTPPESIAAEAAQRRASVVGLSATIATNLDAVTQSVRALRRRSGCADLPIIAGGRPFLLAPNLARRLGADAMATDAAHAVQVAGKLLVRRTA